MAQRFVKYTPTAGDVHVDQPLTNISIAFMQSADRFVADRVFPNIPVQKKSDVYYAYDRGEFNRDEMRERAPGTESAGGGFKLDNTPSYRAITYAFHKDIPDEVRANSDSVINTDRDATMYVTMKGMIKRETLWTNQYFKSGVWGTDVTPTTLWDAANSTPIKDVRDGKRAVLEETGIEPNIIVLGKKVYDSLLDHPEIIDRIKYGQTPGSPAIVNRQALAALFELDEIVVASAVQNTAAETAAAYSLDNTPSGYHNHSFIAGNHALLCYSAPSPGLMVPSAGYTFSWTGFLAAGPMGNRIKNIRVELKEADRIENQMSFTQKLVASELGYFFNSVVS